MTPEEILKSKLTIETMVFGSPDYTFRKVIESMREYGKQQWNEAIKLAAESVRLSLNGTNTPYGEHSCKQGDWTCNKEFILELLKP